MRVRTKSFSKIKEILTKSGIAEEFAKEGVQFNPNEESSWGNVSIEVEIVSKKTQIEEISSTWMRCFPGNWFYVKSGTSDDGLDFSSEMIPEAYLSSLKEKIDKILA